MKNLNHKMLRAFFKTALLLMMGMAFTGCKKYFDPPDVFETQKIVKVKKRKVLLVVIDGVSGADLKAIAPPKITAMLANSKYTWGAYSDYVVSDGANWKNIMTGVSVGKHGVADSTLDVGNSGIGNEHATQTVWPTFIERLQGTGKLKRAVTITTWNTLSNKLFAYADQPILANSDLAVRDSALNKITNGNNELIIANYSEAIKAGIATGFSPSNTAYKNAVLQTDSYIGDMLEAIKNRKTYADEDWLVIVTSTHGGTNNGYGQLEHRDAERKVFTLYYYQGFKGQEFEASAFMDAVKFSSNSITARLSGNDADMYNLGNTGDYTIEFRLRIHAFGTLNSTIFFKSSSPANSSPGWWFIHNGSDGSWRFVVRRGPSGGANKTLTSKDLGAAGPALMVTNRWYRLTAKIYTENSKRYMVIYQDGVKASNPLEITGENIVNSEDLYAGFKSGYGNLTNQTISDIRIWNTALSDAKILENACSTSVSSADPNYGNLIGYWPGNDGLSSYKNYSPLAVGKDLDLAGAYSWEPLPIPTCGADTALPDNQLVFRNSDIFAQIFYWFGVKPDAKWAIDSQEFLSRFEAEFYKSL